MPAIIGAILGGLYRLIVDKLGYFIAMKALMLTLLVVVLPLVLKDVVIWFVGQVMCLITAIMGEGYIQELTIELSGVGAYLAQTTQLPFCFAMIVTAMCTRFMMNVTPFVK
jgi:hypothetical protein